MIVMYLSILVSILIVVIDFRIRIYAYIFNCSCQPIYVNMLLAMIIYSMTCDTAIVTCTIIDGRIAVVTAITTGTAAVGYISIAGSNLLGHTTVAVRLSADDEKTMAIATTMDGSSSAGTDSRMLSHSHFYPSTGNKLDAGRGSSFSSPSYAYEYQSIACFYTL
jgi:hypothetical protein